ncbi:zf-TFIIB domain-containing protein [bacterium]|nr:zf-TFIIB domain-containing protein [bacterium]
MLICPACGSSLEPAREAGVELLACGRCPRLWLERNRLPDLLADVRRTISPNDLAALRRVCQQRKKSAVAEAELFGSVEYFPCPQCARPMQRKSFARVSYVVVHVCPEHGLLLTAETLGQVRDFLARGGELLVWERLYADLAEKLRQVVADNPRGRKGADVFPDHPVNLEIRALLALEEAFPPESSALS